MKLNWKHFLIMGIAAVLAIAGFLMVKSLVVSWTFTDLPGIAIVDNGNPGNETELQPELTPEAVVPPSELPPAWDGASRVNILVMGLDYGDWAADRNGPSRTDSMILLTIDPITKTAGMLSLPRDLWVNIPGFDHGRINTAHALGDSYKLPGGGPALAAKTVENFLGVPVQYYAVISFDAFTRMVDEIGCINIWAFEDLDIDPLGKGNTIHLTKDKGYCMEGATLLAYARNRKTLGGDVDRAKRTQQVIIALKDAVMDPANFTTLLSKAPALYQELASGIKTNLSFDDAMKLAMLVKDVSTENIKSNVIDYSMATLASVLSDDGKPMSILVPQPDKIRELIKSGPLTAKIGGVLVKPTLKKLKKLMDPSEEGAAPLLGINGLVFIGHGRSNSVAIKNAIRVAKEAAEAGVLESMKIAMEQQLAGK